MNSSHAIIETDRIILRRFELQDIDDVFAFASDPEVGRYTGDPLVSSKEQAAKIITDVWFVDYERVGYGRWAVYHKADQRVIGFAGLKFLRECNETDLGYRILPPYWGQGITSEMAPPIVDFGFHRLKLDRIVAFAMPENLASIRVLEKTGFSFICHAEYPGDTNPCNWYWRFNPSAPPNEHPKPIEPAIS